MLRGIDVGEPVTEHGDREATALEGAPVRRPVDAPGEPARDHQPDRREVAGQDGRDVERDRRRMARADNRDRRACEYPRDRR